MLTLSRSSDSKLSSSRSQPRRNVLLSVVSALATLSFMQFIVAQSYSLFSVEAKSLLQLVPAGRFQWGRTRGGNNALLLRAVSHNEDQDHPLFDATRRCSLLAVRWSTAVDMPNAAA